MAISKTHLSQRKSDFTLKCIYTASYTTFLNSFYALFHGGGMGKADYIEWIKADLQKWSKADSTYAASQQTLFIVSGSPSNPRGGVLNAMLGS